MNLSKLTTLSTAVLLAFALAGAVLLALGLTGCARINASIDESDDQRCQSYGATPGSDAYVQCRDAQEEQRREAWARLGEVGAQMAQPPPPASIALESLQAAT